MFKEVHRRKLLATVFSIIIFAMGSGVISAWDYGDPLSTFIDTTLFYVFVAGIIIFIYGNMVSYLLEYIFRMWIKPYRFRLILYIILHVLLGCFFGFKNLELAIVGGIAALIYVFIDVWAFIRMKKEKSTAILGVYVGVAFLLIVMTITPLVKLLNPFTKEDALALIMHSGNEKFPKTEGKTIERINGYFIERETIIEKKEEELFYISFKETWKRDKIEGAWHVTYRVDRVKSDVIEGEPNIRPHYNNEEADYHIESVD